MINRTNNNLKKLKKHKEVIAIICFLVSLLCSGCSNEDNRPREVLVPEGAIELETSIAKTYGNAKGIVTVIADDGIYDSCMNLERIFRARDLKCTVAGAISFIDPYKKGWDIILKNGTIEIVNHSYNHIKMDENSDISGDIKKLKHEIVDSDKWYEDWLGYEQIVFVCPENQMCDNGYKILQDNGFYAVRRGQRGFNSLSPEKGIEAGQWLNLMVQGICDEGVDISVRNSWIDSAINDNLWLIEMWHNVMPYDDGYYQTILVNDAEEHLDYVNEKYKSNDIWVATFDEAVKYIFERQNADVKAFVENQRLHLFISLTDGEMAYNTFDQPLTVIVELIDGYKVKDLKQGCIIDGKMIIDLVPGEEAIIELIGE